MKTLLSILLLVNYALLAQDLDVSRNLNVKGKVSINGNSGTVGQVLTSNGTSAPSWNSPATQNIPSKALITLNNNTSTLGRAGYNVNVTTVQKDSVDLVDARYNIGTDITVVSSSTIGNKIVLNSNGLYRIEGQIAVFVSNVNASIHPVGSITLLIKDGNTNISLSLASAEPFAQNKFTSPFQFAKTMPFALNYYFTSGDSFTFEVSIGELTSAPQTNLGVSSSSSLLTVSKISD